MLEEMTVNMRKNKVAKRLGRFLHVFITLAFIISMSSLGVLFNLKGVSAQRGVGYTLKAEKKDGTFTDTNIDICNGTACYGNGESVPVKAIITGLTAGETYKIKVQHSYRGSEGIISFDHFENLGSEDGSASGLSFSNEVIGEAIGAKGEVEVLVYDLNFTALSDTVNLNWDAVLGDNAVNYNLKETNLFINIIRGIDDGYFVTKTVSIGPESVGSDLGYILQAQKKDGTFTTGDICEGATCYNNGDSVPVKLIITGLTSGETYEVEVQHNYKGSEGVIAYDRFENPGSWDGSASGVSFTDSGIGSSEAGIAYTLGFTALSDTVNLKWEAVLGDNALNFNLQKSNLYLYFVRGINNEYVFPKTVFIKPTSIGVQEVVAPGEEKAFFVFKRGNGGGTVEIFIDNEKVKTCGNDCDGSLTESEELKLVATANEGSTFLGWSVNSDNTNREPQNENSEISMNLSEDTNIFYAKFELNDSIENPVVDEEDRDVPRVMFWFGKVNQYWDLDEEEWKTDPDGFSGARENKLDYCKKFYPETEKVVSYKKETINTWKTAGNFNNYTSTRDSYRCVLSEEDVPGNDVSDLAEVPSSGSICYYFPENPLCLPLSDSRAIRSPFVVKLDNFVESGVDDNSIKLGKGERAAVLKSYELAFKSLPSNDEEYENIIKIANGNWPSGKSVEMESRAIEEFKKIYKRFPDFANKHDEAAIKVMAYGLRQKAENRNISSEAAALKTFRAVYKKLPESTLDWNILQAITYSGAIREADSDGDLLSDRRELELGTDPSNKDTDGDGYFDGIEVANGYDPLKDESAD